MVMTYWLLSILFVLAVLGVPVALGLAVWTEDGRWGWTALLSAGAAFIFMFLAATIESDK